MAKRFTATEIWSEDWFLDMPNEYKLFWYYMLSNCDHAGVYKVNVRSFRGLLEVSITPNTALEHFNLGKNRIRILSESVWFIEDFFVYQYGTIINFNNKTHDSIGKIYKKYGIELTSIRGLVEVKDKSIDKDKDKDKDKDHKSIQSKFKIGENGEKNSLDARTQSENLFLRRISEGEQQVKRDRQKDN